MEKKISNFLGTKPIDIKKYICDSRWNDEMETSSKDLQVPFIWSVNHTTIS
jgi:hypothetical protein